MQLPTIHGVIDRRVLVNYRVDPDALRKIVPSPLRPQIVDGFGIAGICLIRLKEIRPAMIPACLGIGSENAAHRIAVEWDDAGEPNRGVYVPRRDTSSLLNHMTGGRLFPGEQHRARFTVSESDEQLDICLKSDDAATVVELRARITNDLPAASVFRNLSEASAFFQAGSLGYSASSDSRRLDGMELRCETWSMTPLDVSHVRSSFFEDTRVFPSGSVAFDCALLMRDIKHEWINRKQICCDPIAQVA